MRAHYSAVAANTRLASSAPAQAMRLLGPEVGGEAKPGGR